MVEAAITIRNRWPSAAVNLSWACWLGCSATMLSDPSTGTLSSRSLMFFTRIETVPETSVFGTTSTR